MLVEMGGCQSILASTSLELEPLDIIRLYSYRFRIECTFRELKQQMGAFCYHFWSKQMPKLSHYRKKGEPSPLEQVQDEKAKRKILEAGTCHGNAHGAVLHCNRDTPKPVHLFNWQGQFQPTPLPEDSFQGKDIGRCPHALYAKVFFPSYNKDIFGVYVLGDNGGRYKSNPASFLVPDLMDTSWYRIIHATGWIKGVVLADIESEKLSEIAGRAVSGDGDVFLMDERNRP